MSKQTCIETAMIINERLNLRIKLHFMLLNAYAASELTLAEVAVRMRTTERRVESILSGGVALTINAAVSLAHALGLEIRVKLHPRAKQPANVKKKRPTRKKSR